MKKYLILIIGISLLSCSNKNNNKISYKKHNLEFLNWNINIPENYVRITFEDYKKKILENYSDSIYISNKIKQIENFESSDEPYAFFSDTANIENIFIIYFMLNEIPNKILKNEIANEIHSNFKEKGIAQDYEYKPMENKLINDWLIKIKGENKFESKKTTYSTVYFSSNFGAYVSSTNKELDFEKELTE
jgi:hypothetical protein